MYYIEDRELVIPGQHLATKERSDHSCYSEDDESYAIVAGLARIDDKGVRVIPAVGSYVPKREDLIVGVVSNIIRERWEVDIGSAYKCTLEAEEVVKNSQGIDLRKHYNIGDMLSAKVGHVNEIKATQLIRPWKITDGVFIKVNPKRIPRVVGKKKSMLNMIKEKTNSKIVVGQNGIIWISGPNPQFVVQVIKKIEREAQTKGLTDRISEYLDEYKSKKRN